LRRRCTQRLYGIDADQMSKIIGRIVLNLLYDCFNLLYGLFKFIVRLVAVETLCTTSQYEQRQNYATFELFVVLIILRRCTQRLYCIDADKMSKIIGRIV